MNAWHHLLSTWREQIAALLPTVEVAIPEEPRTPRERIIAQLRGLEERSNAEAIARQARIEALGVRIREAEAHMNELYGELETLWGERIAHSFRVDQELSRLQAELAATSQQGEYAHGNS